MANSRLRIPGLKHECSILKQASSFKLCGEFLVPLRGNSCPVRSSRVHQYSERNQAVYAPRCLHHEESDMSPATVNNLWCRKPNFVSRPINLNPASRC